MALIPSSMEKLTPEVLERKRRELLARMKPAAPGTAPTPILGYPFPGAATPPPVSVTRNPVQPELRNSRYNSLLTGSMPPVVENAAPATPALSAPPVAAAAPIRPVVAPMAPKAVPQGPADQYPLTGLKNPMQAMRPGSYPDMIRNREPLYTPGLARRIAGFSPIPGMSLKVQGAYGIPGGPGLKNPLAPVRPGTLPAMERGMPLAPAPEPQTVSSPSSTRPEVKPAIPPPATVAASGVSNLETLANTVGGAKLMRPGQFFAKGAAGTMSGQVDTGLGIDHSKPTTMTPEELYRIGPGSDLSKVPVAGARSFAANTPYKGRIIPQVQPMYRGDTSMSQSVASRQKATADRNQAFQEKIGLMTAGQPLVIERAKSAEAQAGRAFTGEQNRLSREADQKRAETTGEYGVKEAAARPIAERPADYAKQLEVVHQTVMDIQAEPDSPDKPTRLAEALKAESAVRNQMAGGDVPGTPGSAKPKTMTLAEFIKAFKAKSGGIEPSPALIQARKGTGEIVG